MHYGICANRLLENTSHTQGATLMTREYQAHPKIFEKRVRYLMHVKLVLKGVDF